MVQNTNFSCISSSFLNLTYGRFSNPTWEHLTVSAQKLPRRFLPVSGWRHRDSLVLLLLSGFPHKDSVLKLWNPWLCSPARTVDAGYRIKLLNDVDSCTVQTRICVSWAGIFSCKVVCVKKKYEWQKKTQNPSLAGHCMSSLEFVLKIYYIKY